jgi:two-component system chemotaxis sensor kinase CheA
VVRNAIDHGLEDASERRSRGKSPAGKLVLETSVDGDEFIVAIEDDGRGIDWELVRAKAKSLGVPHATDAELAEALFADGLSTRSEVGAISGRGIGMGAVRAACHERGGTMRVGRGSRGGTRVEFRFPRREMAEDAEYRRAS